MYERQFETEWEDLTIEEATRRAYAIGVATSLGEDHESEFKRIYAHFDTPYNRSLVELSFEEGRNRARKEVGAGGDQSDIWDDLVASGEIDRVEPTPFTRGGQSVPSAVQRATMLNSPLDGPLDAIGLPDFLRGP